MELKELIERVRVATGPDRDLDLSLLPLWEADHPALRNYSDKYHTEIRDGVFSVWSDSYSSSTPFPRLTASIDAALALVERCLPGFSMRLATADITSSDRNPMSGAVAELVPNLHNDEAWKVGIKSASAQTLPLAIILALLTALDQKEENK